MEYNRPPSFPHPSEDSDMSPYPKADYWAEPFCRHHWGKGANTLPTEQVTQRSHSHSR